jgi:hypothetical protein
VGKTHIGDDRVTIVGGHKVLYGTRRGILQLVTADEVVCEVVLGGVGEIAVRYGHSAIGVWSGRAVDLSLSHDEKLTLSLF